MFRIVLTVSEVVPKMAFQLVGFFYGVAVSRFEGVELSYVLADFLVQVGIRTPRALDKEPTGDLMTENIHTDAVFLYCPVDSLRRQLQGSV